jgi:hypothetical protein
MVLHSCIFIYAEFEHSWVLVELDYGGAVNAFGRRDGQCL